MSNQVVGDCFKCLWPFQNVRTLNLADYSIQQYINHHVEFLFKFSDKIAVKDERVQEVMKPINDQKTYAMAKPAHLQHNIQAFLDFHGFNFRDFGFTAVYNSTLFTRFLLPRFFVCVPHINSVISCSRHRTTKFRIPNILFTCLINSTARHCNL